MSVFLIKCVHKMIDSKDYSDADSHNGPCKLYFAKCVLVLPQLMEYSYSVVIASNPGFLFLIFFVVAVLEKNWNGKPWLKASVIS